MHWREKATGTLTLSLAWNQTESKTYLNSVKIPKLKHACMGWRNGCTISPPGGSIWPIQRTCRSHSNPHRAGGWKFAENKHNSKYNSKHNVAHMCWLQTFQMLNRSKWRLWRSLNKEIWTKIRRQDTNRRTKHRSNDCRIGCCHRCPVAQELVPSVAMLQERDRTSLELEIHQKLPSPSWIDNQISFMLARANLRGSHIFESQRAALGIWIQAAMRKLHCLYP